MTHPSQGNFDETLKQYYQILRCRQTQIIGIIKETTELVETVGFNQEISAADKNSERKLNLAFSMINALANILDEQVKALDIWERILAVGERSSEPTPSGPSGIRVDYEISVN